MCGSGFSEVVKNYDQWPEICLTLLQKKKKKKLRGRFYTCALDLRDSPAAERVNVFLYLNIRE